MKVEAKKTDAKAIVAVSPAMQNLRKTQTMLNHFLWSTEIAYRFILSKPEVAEMPSTTPAVDAFGDLIAEAWFPNVQGTIKFNEAVGTTLTQIGKNLPFIYRSVSIFFFAAFDDYLKNRLGKLPVQVHDARGFPMQIVAWGPYYENLPLRIPRGQQPIRPATIICADICRLIRNKIIHEPEAPLPASLQEPIVVKWRHIIERKLFGDFGNNYFTSADVTTAFNLVIGNATRDISQARERNRDLPPEFFYALYSFTNFDALAFEIEEALISQGIVPHGRIRRSRKSIRRTDLIVSDA